MRAIAMRRFWPPDSEGAALAHDCIIAVLELHYELVRIGPALPPDYLLIGRVGTAV